MLLAPFLLAALQAEAVDPNQAISTLPCHIQPERVQAAVRRHFAARGETRDRKRWHFDCRPEWQPAIVCGWLVVGESPDQGPTAPFWAELGKGGVLRSRISAAGHAALQIDRRCHKAGYSRVLDRPTD